MSDVNFNTAIQDLQNKLERQLSAVRRTESMIEAMKATKKTYTEILEAANAKTPREQTKK